MQKIIDYLKEYPQYTKVLIISFAVIAVLTAVILILRSIVNKKREATKTKTDKTVTSEAKTQIKLKQAQLEAKEKNETAAKTQTNLPAAKNEAASSQKTQPIGKWIISEQNGKFVACLIAENETLLTSESYGSLSGLKSGVDTLKNNLQTENYAINVDRNGGFYFKLFSTANRLLCISRSYPTRERCENAFFKCKHASLNAPVITER